MDDKKPSTERPSSASAEQSEVQDETHDRTRAIEHIRVAAMRAWAEKVLEADHAWSRELERASKELGIDISPEEAASDDERTALNVTRWFGWNFVHRERAKLHKQTRDHIARIESAQYHDQKGPKTALAVAVVREHAESYLAARKGGPEYRGNTCDEIVQILWVDLWATVDKAFGALETRQPEVHAVLGRYEPDPAARGRINAGKRKNEKEVLIDANGVTQELAELARWTIKINYISTQVKAFGRFQDD